MDSLPNIYTELKDHIFHFDINNKKKISESLLVRYTEHITHITCIRKSSWFFFLFVIVSMYVHISEYVHVRIIF